MQYKQKADKREVTCHRNHRIHMIMHPSVLTF